MNAHTFDLTPLLPSWAWVDSVKLAIEQHGRHVERTQPGPGSLEPGGLRYTVVDRPSVSACLPWLVELHASLELRAMIERALGERVKPGEHPRSSLNVNYLSGRGAKYEKHLDTQPFTMVAFVDTLGPNDGGALELTSPTGAIVEVWPRKGHAVIFDGSTTPHRVTPLITATSRTTLVMEFWRLNAQGDDRSATVDYLYGEG